MEDFEGYVIRKLDSIENKVADLRVNVEEKIHKIKLSQVKKASIIGSISGVIAAILTVLTKG